MWLICIMVDAEHGTSYAWLFFGSIGWYGCEETFGYFTTFERTILFYVWRCNIRSGYGAWRSVFKHNHPTTKLDTLILWFPHSRCFGCRTTSSIPSPTQACTSTTLPLWSSSYIPFRGHHHNPLFSMQCLSIFTLGLSFLPILFSSLLASGHCYECTFSFD